MCFNENFSVFFSEIIHKYECAIKHNQLSTLRVMQGKIGLCKTDLGFFFAHLF